MNENLQRILSGLDLEPIIVKAMTEKGYAWNYVQASKVAEEYRRYLVLCILYPDEAIVPSNVVDEFWHLHILDTQKYADDCVQFIGYFLHHFPYFGMRGEQDAKNLESAWFATLDRYKLAFGVHPPKEIWPESNRCPNCGRRANSISLDNRPTLKDIGLAVS